MALKKTVTFENGLIITDAYIRIVSAGTDKISANITVRYFTDNEKQMPVYENMYMFHPDMSDAAVNLWKQGYEHLKTLPDFDGAEDVLEDGQHA